MYKYSKKAEEKFFAQPPLAFLFAVFSASKLGIDYTREKLFTKNSPGEGDSSNLPELVPQSSESVSKRSQKAQRKATGEAQEIDFGSKNDRMRQTQHQLEMNLRIINEMRNLSVESRRQLIGKPNANYSGEERSFRRKLSFYIESLIH